MRANRNSIMSSNQPQLLRLACQCGDRGQPGRYYIDKPNGAV
jgi:hypothetical protein